MSKQLLNSRNLAELSEWDRNYRLGDVDAIVSSIIRFGFNGALRVWKNGTVIAGNHALKAIQTIKARGLSAPPGIEDRDGVWFVPCIDVSRLSQLEADAFAVADNRTQELGKDDPERLLALLKDLNGDLLAELGYDEFAIEQLAADLKALGGESAKDPSKAPEEFEVKDPEDFTLICPQCGHAWSAV